jgi:hypothetical protein
MDFEGNNMWMLSLNVGNSGGEMRFVSMDGQTSKNNISGLSAAHHDLRFCQARSRRWCGPAAAGIRRAT